MSKKNFYNETIINELKKLPTVLVNKRGNLVYIRDKSRSYESGYEHIAKISHNLKKKDIKSLPDIIRNPILVRKDSKFDNKYNYFGKAYDNNKCTCFIKIVTKKISKTDEEIVTAFRTNNLKK